LSDRVKRKRKRERGRNSVSKREMKERERERVKKKRERERGGEINMMYEKCQDGLTVWLSCTWRTNVVW
jgi:hypothetical protein